ncbi:hypothetical protein JCM11641_003591 [Rhodosporidiobolus odoratus]
MPSPPPYSPHNPQLSPPSQAQLAMAAQPPQLPPHLPFHRPPPSDLAYTSHAPPQPFGEPFPSPSTSGSGSGGNTPRDQPTALAGSTGHAAEGSIANGHASHGTKKKAARPDIKGKRKASDVGYEEEVDAQAGGSDKPEKQKKKVKVGARASIACKTCRKRKVRCSAEWPVCSFCSTKKMECVYDGHPAENGGTLLAGPSGIIPNHITALEAELPGPPIVLEALNVFFIHYYDTFPFLHRATLTEEIKNGTAPKELLCCILALAARFCQALKDLHPSSASPAHEYYARVASELLTLPETTPGQSAPLPSADTTISLMRCQCFCLVGFYEITAGRDNSGWLKIGTAIRMAQVLRLGFEDEIGYMSEHEQRANGEDEATADPSQASSRALHAELRRRVFWALFALDRTVSDGNERPCGLKVPRIASLRMPGPDADFQAGHKSLGAKFDPDPPAWSLSMKTPPGEGEPEADLYGHTLRIAEIWSKVASYIGSGGRIVDRRCPWKEESTFAQLERDLSDFERKLPDVLKYSQQTMLAHCMSSQMEARMFGMLHLLNAGARHVLHRDYLPFLPPIDFKAANGPVDGEPLYGDPTAPPGWWQQSFNMAAESANTISDVCTLLCQHGIILTHPFAGFAAVAAGTVHCHLRFWPQSSSVPNDAVHLHYFNQDVEIVDGLRGTYPIAERWYENLAGLAVLYFSVSRGVLDADPVKIRAGLLQLMRSSKEDTDPAPRQPTATAKKGPASRPPKAAKALASSAVPPHLLPPSGSAAPRDRTLSEALDALVPTPAGGSPTSGLPNPSNPPPQAGFNDSLAPPPFPSDLDLPTDFFDLAAMHSGLGGFGLGLSTLDDAGYYWGGNSWGLAGFGGLGGAFAPPVVPQPGAAGGMGAAGQGYGDLAWHM